MTESRFHFSEEKPLRWGVIGCGSVTEKKSVPAYKDTLGFRVDMVMRRNTEKVEDYAKRHNIPKWTTNADEVINNPNIDAIYTRRRSWLLRRGGGRRFRRARWRARR